MMPAQSITGFFFLSLNALHENQPSASRGWKCHHSPLTVGRIPYSSATWVMVGIDPPRVVIRKSTAYDHPSGCS